MNTEWVGGVESEGSADRGALSYRVGEWKIVKRLLRVSIEMNQNE